MSSPLFGVVSSDSLRKAAAMCTNTNSEIQVQILKMISLVENLIADGASGTDITQLNSDIQQWQTDSNQLNYVLSTIANGLNQTAANYDQNEINNTRNMAVVGTNMPAAKF